MLGNPRIWLNNLKLKTGLRFPWLSLNSLSLSLSLSLSTPTPANTTLWIELNTLFCYYINYFTVSTYSVYMSVCYSIKYLTVWTDSFTRHCVTLSISYGVERQILHVSLLLYQLYHAVGRQFYTSLYNYQNLTVWTDCSPKNRLTLIWFSARAACFWISVIVTSAISTTLIRCMATTEQIIVWN